MRIKYIHHASFIIFFKENGIDKVMYIDPYKISPKDNHKADYILVSHEHYDHYSIDDIKKISTANTKIFLPDKLNSELEKTIQVQKIHTHDSISINNTIKIGTIPAYNTNKPYHVKEKGVGYIIDIIEHNKHHTIYHAGDTDFVQEMKILKGIDYAIIPIGGTYTMDDRDASEFVKIVKPKNVIPMHFGDKLGIGLSNNYEILEKTCKDEKIKFILLKEDAFIEIY